MHHPVSHHVVGGVDPNATAARQENPATSSPYPAPRVPPAASKQDGRNAGGKTTVLRCEATEGSKAERPKGFQRECAAFHSRGRR